MKALKAAGVIACEDEEELADRYMLPAKRRWAALLELLQFLVSATIAHMLFHNNSR